jgi:hypothetical protein
VSDAGNAPELRGDILEVVRELGLFRVGDVVALTELSGEEIERWLGANSQRVEELADRKGTWRMRPAPAAPDRARPTANPKAAEELTDAAVAALRTIGRGMVQEREVRDVTLEAAEQKLELAQSAAGDDKAPRLRARLGRARRRLATLRAQGDEGPGPLLAELRDWTAELSTSDNEEGEPPSFDIGAAVRAAEKQAAHPNAVFAPARAAQAAGLTSSQRQDLADRLDRDLRSAALLGSVFDVLALSCVAAVIGVGSLADALVAAITTPSFHSRADRTALRIAYTALANLARPGTIDGYRAVEACTYLMRREPPGREEMELLAPAALLSEAIDSRAALVLLAQWLKWEGEHDPSGPRHTSLPQFGHVARNLGCALDSSGYEPLERALPALVEDDLGVLLVRHLSDSNNGALEFRPRPPESMNGVADIRRQFGALARAPVARVTDPARNRPYTYLTIDPHSRIARAIEELVLRQEPELPRPDFTSSLRRRAHGHD